MKIYNGQCERCEAKGEVVAIYRNAYIPDTKADHPDEIYEICEPCLSVLVAFDDDVRGVRYSEERTN